MFSFLQSPGVGSKFAQSIHLAVFFPLLTAYILQLLTDEPVFNPDIQQVRKEERLVKLVSDGACAPNLARNAKEVRLSRRGIFGEGSADGICIGLCCKPGPVTLARLYRIRGKYCLHSAFGEAYEPPKEKLEEEIKACGFPYWPHAFIRLEGNLDTFVQNQRSEYISMCYGDVREELLDLCYLLGIEPIITK
jgi:L-fucose isomerase-like protein